MKIGILTYHRSHNYGALLQAVALRTVLQGMGHEVCYVDYRPEYHKKMYAPFSWSDFSSYGLRTKAFYLLEYPQRKRRYANFIPFIDKEIVPYCHDIDEEYDVIIYGSDQIWRKQNAIGGFNPVYFGDNHFKAKKHVSYAASMGIMKLTDSDKQTLKSLVGHLDAVSVREEGLKELLTSIGVEEVNLSLDPTLLLSSDEWDKALPGEKAKGNGYVFVYELLNDSFNNDAVKRFAKKRGLDVIKIEGISVKPSLLPRRITDSPYSFLNLIRNAEFVFTSSYHGLVFSLLYGKQFYTAFPENADRARNLLSEAGLSDYMIPVGCSQIPELPSIDFQTVYSRLEPIRKKSIDYIKKSLVL